jgi:hypothetical protein
MSRLHSSGGTEAPPLGKFRQITRRKVSLLQSARARCRKRPLLASWRFQPENRTAFFRPRSSYSFGLEGGINLLLGCLPQTVKKNATTGLANSGCTRGPASAQSPGTCGVALHCH